MLLFWLETLPLILLIQETGILLWDSVQQLPTPVLEDTKTQLTALEWSWKSKLNLPKFLLFETIVQTSLVLFMQQFLQLPVIARQL